MTIWLLASKMVIPILLWILVTVQNLDKNQRELEVKNSLRIVDGIKSSLTGKNYN